MGPEDASAGEGILGILGSGTKEEEPGRVHQDREPRPVTAMLRPAQRAGLGRDGAAPKPWLRGDAKADALISSVDPVPL